MFWQPPKRCRAVTLAALSVLAAAARAPAQGGTGESARADSVLDALTKGKVSVGLRYRFEVVDDDNFSKTATASTLRTTLGYRTKSYEGFDLFVQMEDVTDVGLGNRYNNKGFDGFSNHVTNRPVVADPNGTELLQGYLHFKRKGSDVKVGVQEITYDDHRFIGNVGWRQHHQTYDALRYSNTDVENLTINYAFVNSVNRIFRQRVDAEHHLLNVQYRIPDIGAITAYGYRLRYRVASFRGSSTDTYGAEFKGSRGIDARISVQYEAEFAHQVDGGTNPNNVDADYFHFSLGGKYEKYGIAVGWERLDGSSADGQFQTPLATLHAMNGWADKFLSTPTNGLDDVSVKLYGPAGPATWTFVFHDFSASSSGGGDYGREYDALVTWKSSWKQVFGLKAAFYDADGFSKDATKVWLFSIFNF